VFVRIILADVIKLLDEGSRQNKSEIHLRKQKTIPLIKNQVR